MQDAEEIPIFFLLFVRKLSENIFFFFGKDNKTQTFFSKTCKIISLLINFALRQHSDSSKNLFLFNPNTIYTAMSVFLTLQIIWQFAAGRRRERITL